MYTCIRLAQTDESDISSFLCFLALALVFMLLPYTAVPAAGTGKPLALHEAVKHQDAASLQQHIANSDSLDAQDAEGWTALMHAVKNGRQQVVAMLLEAGASANVTDRWSRSPLHLAAEGKPGMVRMLIKAGADLDKRNSGGVTPLMMAAGSGRQDIVELLLRSGARLDLKDYQDNSVANWARRSGNKPLVAKLEKKLATVKQDDSRASSENFAEDVYVDVKYPDWFKLSFLDLGEDVKEAVSDGKQGIMIFLSTRRCSYCKAFIQNSLKLPDIRQRVQQSFDVIGMEIFDDSEMTDPAGRRYRVKEYVSANKAAYTPTMIFYGAGGKELLKIVGYYPPDKFRTVLDYLEGEHYNNEPLRDYTARVNAAATKQAGDIQKDHEIFSRPPYILDRRLRKADRPLLVVFEQPNCTACERFHKRVLGDESVRRLMGRYETVQLDATDTNSRVVLPSGDRVSPKQWFEQLDLNYRPATVFFDESGKEVMRLDSETQRYRMEGTLQLVLEKGYENDAQLQRWRKTKAVQLYQMQQGGKKE